MLRELLGGLAVVGSSLWAVFQVGVLNIDLLQTALIPLAFTVAPEVPWLDTTMLQNIALFVTVVFVGLTLFRLADKAVSRVRGS